MELRQNAAIILHKEKLIEVLQPAVLFLSYLEEKGVIDFNERQLVEASSTLTKDQLLRLFGLLQQNEKGWSAVIAYLRGHHKIWFADVLEKTANEQLSSSGICTFSDNMPKQSALEVFSRRLANYYRLNYVHLPTIGESPKHVKDVWVPLQIDGRSEDQLPSDRVEYSELLNRLKSSEDRNVALIKGDPGMGKTTLAKKIAYDWAVNYGSANEQQFSLVLAVPLRYVGNADLFDQLATDYFFSIGAGRLVKGIIKEELTEEISELESQLLVILDGLDEYASYSESPFKLVFAPPFKLLLANVKKPPPIISFKLIVTSRPYASERVNDNFWPLRFAILPLDANRLSDFVSLYCQTQNGIAKVTQYLNVNAELVIKVPLILTFVCYLADSEDEIPTNMTSLYDSLIRQMIRREIRQGKLSESVDIHKWKESNLVKTTCELAFREINADGERNFEFTSDSLDKSHVTNDSFICGFLLHKFDFIKDLLKAEFPHRSIQEFFAALHCYQLMLSGRKDELGEIRNLIFRGDSQFGRFLFGICSQEGNFGQMLNWLSPSLGDTADVFWSLDDEVNQFGSSLIDCSPEENTLMGERLLESIGHLEEIIITSQTHLSLFRLNYPLRLRNLSAEFKDSLRLVALTRDSSGFSYDWYVADNRQSARLAVVSSTLPKLLEENFDMIDILVWFTPIDRISGMDWKTLISQIRSLPPVRTIIMSTGSSPFSFTSVFVHIGYVGTTVLELTNFRFGYKNEQRKELLEAVPDEQLVKLTNNKREAKIYRPGGPDIVINVTVDSCESQSALIFSLIRLSLLPPVRSSNHRCVCV